jgi:PhoH-like ATPase
MATKTFVLDTNVLLHSAQSLESFQDNNIVLPMAVIEELDKFKKYQDELGRNARQVIRTLDALREKGHLGEGVSLSKAGSLATGKITICSVNSSSSQEIDKKLKQTFDTTFSLERPDNRILRVALSLHMQNKNVIFISKDINLRLKADALGLKVMDFEREKVDYDKLFTGQQIVSVKQHIIDEIYQSKIIEVEGITALPNEFIVLESEENPKKTALARFKVDGMLHLVDPRIDSQQLHLSPRNKEQRMALDILLDPEVQLVSLVGKAGTGKTLLALAAALELVLHQNRYEKILVSRPIVPLGNDIGFLPGDKDEKLSHWMQPIFDNLDYLMHSDKNDHVSSKKTDTLIGNQKIELEAITYIRGRSLPRQFVIVDEAQNLTPHEVKTIISRAGEGTKMVLTGDPNQIDNPYLDASSNGLTYTVERMKGLSLHGHMTLEKSERSELAAKAAELL